MDVRTELELLLKEKKENMVLSLKGRERRKFFLEGS